MAWPPPNAGDLVWCFIPYAGATKERHPALVLDVDANQVPARVVVVGAASFQKVDDLTKRAIRRTSDVLIDSTFTGWKRTGLTNPTLIHLAKEYIFIFDYSEDFFTTNPNQHSPKIGSLDLTDPTLSQAFERAAMAANLGSTLEGLGVMSKAKSPRHSRR